MGMKILTSHQIDMYNHALKIMWLRYWSLTDSFTNSEKTVLEENLILQIHVPFFYHDTKEMQEPPTCNVDRKLMSHTDAQYDIFIAVQGQQCWFFVQFIIHAYQEILNF